MRGEALRRRALVWGATTEERGRPFPCDDHLAGPDQAMLRAVDAQAPAATVFRWLCQLRIAPYSYDWLDSWGRRSPRALTASLDKPVKLLVRYPRGLRGRALSAVLPWGDLLLMRKQLLTLKGLAERC